MVCVGVAWTRRAHQIDIMGQNLPFQQPIEESRRKKKSAKEWPEKKRYT